MADKTGTERGKQDEQRADKVSNHREEVKGSGVYPASGPLPPGEAVVRGQAEWGQGERGAAGYEDSGESEAIPVPPEGQPEDVNRLYRQLMKKDEEE